MKAIRRLYRKSCLYRMINRRRVQVYCAGSAKSGTHSIAAMFDGTARASHEPGAKELLDAVLLRANNGFTPDAWRQYVLRRDRQLWLEVDSSHLNVHLLDVLVRERPDARFILTIRDCYSWLESMINHQLNKRGPLGIWPTWAPFAMRATQFTHPPEEAALKERGLFTLDGYFSHWADLNTTVLNVVPEERLLVVRTNEISQQAEQIARFAGLPRSPSGQTHAYKAKAKHSVLSSIDPDHLRRKVEQYCRPLMERFFPDMATPRSAIAAAAGEAV